MMRLSDWLRGGAAAAQLCFIVRDRRQQRCHAARIDATVGMGLHFVEQPQDACLELLIALRRGVNLELEDDSKNE
jgi:hypothetical protein